MPGEVSPSRGDPALAVALSSKGQAAGERFGAALAGVGDLDGDGRAELAVGAPGAEAAGPGGTAWPGAGRVVVVRGKDGTPLFEARGGKANARFGTAVAGVGDVDGDGTADLAVGAPYGAAASGRVALLSGRDGAVLWTRDGPAGGDRFGAALAGIGDVSGDGVPDLAVGAPASGAGGLLAGELHLVSGLDGSVLRSVHGAQGDLFAHAVAAHGDADGDGVGDVLVGAPLADANGFNSGAVHVVSGATGELLVTFAGERAGDRLGERVAVAEDVDGDGVTDWLAVGPGADGAAFDCGAAQVRSGKDGRVLFTVRGRAAGEYLAAASGAGDVDGDGRADVAVGSADVAGAGGQGSGRVRVVSGATGCDLAVIDGPEPNDWLGAVLACAGDVDGDGRPDLALGAPGHDDDPTKAGRALVLSGALRHRATPCGAR